jgi:hypothetical protein
MNLWVPRKSGNMVTNWAIYLSKKHSADWRYSLGGAQETHKHLYINNIWVVCRSSCGLPNAIRVYIASLSTFAETCTFVYIWVWNIQISTLWSCHTNVRAKSYGLVFRTERGSWVRTFLHSLFSYNQYRDYGPAVSRCGAAQVNSIEITFSGLLPWRRSPSVRSLLTSITSLCLSFAHEIWALHHPRFPSVTQKFTASCEISTEYVPLCPSSRTDCGRDSQVSFIYSVYHCNYADFVAINSGDVHLIVIRPSVAEILIHSFTRIQDKFMLHQL